VWAGWKYGGNLCEEFLKKSLDFGAGRREMLNAQVYLDLNLHELGVT
jgi:hypothetical protein